MSQTISLGAERVWPRETSVGLE